MAERIHVYYLDGFVEVIVLLDRLLLDLERLLLLDFFLLFSLLLLWCVV